MKVRVNVMAVVLNKGKILLVKQALDNYWGFPKGGVENDETQEDALKRELLEELGLTEFEIIKKSNYTLEYFVDASKMLKKINSIYFVKTNRLDFVLNGELAEIKWVRPNELTLEIDFQNQKDLCAKLLFELSSFQY